jgi:hypothetical protein
MDMESVVHGVIISEVAERRLRAAARIHEDLGYQGTETPEHELHEMTRQLTGLEFEDLVPPTEILGRRPYRCIVCGEPFSLVEYNETRMAAREAHEPHPFFAGRQQHVRCASSSK